MADTYVVEYQKRDQDGQYAPAPEGLQQVVCVDGIYLGEKVEAFPGTPPKVVRKYALVFQTLDTNPATGRRYELQKEFTISMHEKAALRKFLSSWRGRTYTDDEAKRFELAKVVDAPAPFSNALATVEHKTSQAGRTYGVITNITPLPKSMADKAITPADYVRAPYWEDRKAQYAADVAAHKRAQANGGTPAGAPALSGNLVPAQAAAKAATDALAAAEKHGSDPAAALDAAMQDSELPF